eukprot:scaffold314210_cov30-Tisochrysis_lutea.AAC.2
MSDPKASVFFASQLNSMSDLPEGAEGTIATAPDGRRYFTIADWQVRQCVQEEDCELPGDMVLRGERRSPAYFTGGRERASPSSPRGARPST